MAIPVRPDPDRLLRQALAEEEYERRGRLKIFLGYSSGVGKSFRMFDEAQRRKRRGEDVVVAAVQARNSPEVSALLRRLEIVPTWNGAINVPTLLRRHPEVCLVDGLACANPPGSERAHRWQDVKALVDAGISTIATVNLQFIAEKRLQVEALSGRSIAVEDTVPESFLRSADEIEVVDAPPEAGLAPNRDGLQRQQRLSELRELALLLAADVVEQQLESYLRRHGLESSWGTQERILVCLGAGDAEPMLASGRRNADRFHGELLAVHVPAGSGASEQRRHNLELARLYQAEVHALGGEGGVEAILELARLHRVTQIFIGHATRESWLARLFGSPIERLIRRAEGIDIRVFPQLRTTGRPHAGGT